MLKSLSIQNFVLIDKLHIDFDDGFSVMTGETGAGKSIILGALALALGQRADSRSIQAGTEKCIVEASFDISQYNLELFFAANELEYDSRFCILRRELLSSGKSRAFVNDSPAPLAVIKTLGDRLVDVHSQHQNLLLADTHFQLNVVDIMAGTQTQLQACAETFRLWQTATVQLKELTEKAAKAKEEESYLRFRFEELQAAQLTENEQDSLEQELKTLSHAEDIKRALYQATSQLNGEEQSALPLIKNTLAAMEALTACFPRAGEFAERLRTAYIDLGDLASEAAVMKENIDYEPQRMEWVNNRLNTLYSLQQKYRTPSVEELILHRDTLGIRLQLLDSFEEELAALEKQQAQAFRQLTTQAEEISRLRQAVALTFETQLQQRMTQLGMPHARFQIEFSPRPRPAADGVDDLRFLFSSSRSESLKPVAQTASGGEISRLMLCVKAMIAGYAALPAIIFDEIDTGTSGETAAKIAAIMQELGRSMQVIAITHLPQIAAKGRAHYLVYRQDTEERTLTRIRQLDEAERVQEIARMLSGASLTDASVANARELLGVK